ncbi:bifunctional DNA-formamidopyrimidine glycosylase/DNA-(apurinic or apyrimidinic site) lyase [Glycomyces sp. TRM65418]|uniref:bifunctional DNA-formamidopyrimidine glycosylase/DNA-(apurinic or apyrimidinic site) lyase n=1 Tax=Glycomyces sp. TRM65418 TaxID=2867006 RepID=UPI001CE55266|nr:bifunctional DNA-formamidopyrimidine glycosylase/DNA-(apurinic or apyrimidinic site) lyase [Glycomyces sp. TRM65418]MCC3764943.1 bifunctional DNA-formamidopyrimidine glycosylase/DNA-(apurinic or apyrimidinic site) lyase [Glycomyces sp. TRM65418]QZD54581.1 bifunctional DNA-formamidopyrimidine glycosylase/DNA-(apurinic or apyrimidinic site) lyase [Glycomyces sp. TRM65418]
MPELPEVETVRRGVDAAFRGGRISAVEVYNPRTVRRHAPGVSAFQNDLSGLLITGSGRRGKFMWLDLDDGRALVCHLGMSGQLHVVTDGRAVHKHLRGRMRFIDERELWFIDQRTFGFWEIAEMDGAVPKTLGHIAPDVFEAEFDAAAAAARLLRRRIEVKKALLDQAWISGVGNIYADEALWRSRLRGRRTGESLSRRKALELIGHVKDVLTESLAVGGTSFDELYVDARGEAGYFARELAVYGRAGQPCKRCGTPIQREVIGDRSAHFCPKCQR